MRRNSNHPIIKKLVHSSNQEDVLKSTLSNQWTADDEPDFYQQQIASNNKKPRYQSQKPPMHDETEASAQARRPVTRDHSSNHNINSVANST